MKNLCNKEKQQTRTTGLLLLMRYSRGCLLKLFSSDSAGGASALASTAIDASVCVHDCNAILNSNCTNGASALASAAANTCVRNLVCHNRTLLYLPVLSIYEETCLCTALADPSEIISLTAF